MKEGLVQKFRSDEKMKEALLKTGDAVLVKCSAMDRYWSCGVFVNNLLVLCNPGKWPGRNMLGVLMMEVRDELKNEITKE